MNKIPKIVKIKIERNISNKEHLIKNSNIYNNTEIFDDTYNDNNIIIYNICKTIPYNNYTENETKEEIKYKERLFSDINIEN